MSSGMPYAGSPSQATRKGWPYYIRPLVEGDEPPVSRRATPCGWPALSTCDGEPAYVMLCEIIVDVSCSKLSRMVLSRGRGRDGARGRQEGAVAARSRSR